MKKYLAPIEYTINQILFGKSVVDENELLSLKESAIYLSELFTKGRENIDDYLSKENLRRAYIAHFTLTNAAKVIRCLLQLEKDLTSQREIKVLDVGAGSGSALLAVSSFLKIKRADATVKITALDKNIPILKEADKLFSKLGNKEHILETLEGDAEDLPAGLGKFDVIIAANVLNEIAENRGKVAAKLFDSHLKKDGMFIIIDPALKITARQMMELKADMLDRCRPRTIAPCLHNGGCPMLKFNNRDWCHFYIEWERPELIKKMDELVGTDHTYLKMAYLILMKSHAFTGSFAVAHDDTSRVVSSPLISKGKHELVLCSAGGSVSKTRLLDKDISDDNRRFLDAKRGDIVKSPPVQRLSKTDEFEVVDPWNKLSGESS